MDFASGAESGLWSALATKFNSPRSYSPMFWNHRRAPNQRSSFATGAEESVKRVSVNVKQTVRHRRPPSYSLSVSSRLLARCSTARPTWVWKRDFLFTAAPRSTTAARSCQCQSSRAGDGNVTCVFQEDRGGVLVVRQDKTLLIHSHHSRARRTAPQAPRAPRRSTWGRRREETFKINLAQDRVDPPLKGIWARRRSHDRSANRRLQRDLKLIVNQNWIDFSSSNECVFSKCDGSSYIKTWVFSTVKLPLWPLA